MATTAHSREIDPTNEVILENKDVIVERAHIIGLVRTKADFVQDEIKPLLRCKSFLQAYKVALQCRDGLLSKGIFQSVDVYLDTTEAYDKKLDNGIQVLFKVKERSLLCGEARTEISTRDRPRWVLRLFSPNIFGRGETLSASLSHTFNVNSAYRAYLPNEFSTSFLKPFSDGSDVRFTVLKETLENPWSCCNEVTRGVQLGYNFPFLGNKHSVDWLGHWRELCCVTGSDLDLDIRKQLGHSLKSSIRHTVVIDKTDSPILPKEGPNFKLTEELAGFGGNVRFIKEIFESHYHSTFLNKFTLGIGCQTGILVPIGGTGGKLLVNDKFFIGGPLTLRGFEMNRVGNDRLGIYVGSNCFWMVGGHLYAPLPFYWDRFGRGTWLDNFRLHGFVNAGNAFDFDRSNTISQNCNRVFAKTRMSCGAGIVYNLFDRARVEVNFCLPLRAQDTDFTTTGPQFGIGISSV